MTRARRTAQGLGVVALVVPLSGIGLLLAAGPAYATTGITSPGNGVAFTSDTTVHIAATLDKNSGSADLRLTRPGSTAETVASASSSLTSGASLGYDFDTATCATYPSSCSGRAEAPNGQWTVTLVGGSRTLDTSTFTLRIPPRAPASLSAQADGYRAVVLTWPKGQEPDLTGWTVYADGSQGQDVGTDACSGTSCSTTVTYAQDGTGDHTYSLVAHRTVAPNSTDTLDSSQSPQASATLDAPPPPSPTPADNSGGTTGGTSGGSTGGTSGGSAAGSTGSGSSSAGGSSSGTHSSGSGSSSAIAAGKAPATVAQRRAFALTFKAFAPKLGIPKLPPLPAQPAVAPLADGTYQKTLGYKDVVKREKVSTPQASVRRVTGAVGSALDSGQFLRSIAGALVLLLVAAHLRRWLGSHHTEP
ncbi:MAG: hypothetical protein JWO88_261 [Frankiales bacterium]|nr:hypothetical protein [Frankiales bacterium]